MAQRDLITRLADRGEEMLAKFAETPGAHRVLELLDRSEEGVQVEVRDDHVRSLDRRPERMYAWRVGGR